MQKVYCYQHWQDDEFDETLDHAWDKFKSRQLLRVRLQEEEWIAAIFLSAFKSA